MSTVALRRLIAPTFFLMLFLLPALYVDEAILQGSSNLLQRAIRMGRDVSGICLWRSLAWRIIRLERSFSLGDRIELETGERGEVVDDGERFSANVRLVVDLSVVSTFELFHFRRS